jgi:hypothetical protein
MLKAALSRACVAVVLAALGVGAATPGALATRTVNITSHISIASKGLTFSGKVTSSNAACARGRKVTLYRSRSLVLGTATTNAAGRWKLTVPGSAGITLGRFYAKVRTRSEGTAGTIYVCKAATSKTIGVTP